jgi:hypothetical protein
MAMLTNTQSVSGPDAAGESDAIPTLKGQRPVAGGRQSVIYAHPGNARLLIKVPRDPTELGEPWYKRLRSRHGVLQRALEEHEALRTAAPGDLDLIERIAGWVETDLGRGLAVEALFARTGELAPTLFDLATGGGLNDALRAKLDRFIARIIDSALVAHDLKARNIVLAHNAATGDERLVLVDGIGGRPDFSLDRYSRRLSRFNKRRRVHKLRGELDELSRRAKG